MRREVLVVGPTELEVLDLERPAALDHLVEDRFELLRVDEVPFCGDNSGMSVLVMIVLTLEWTSLAQDLHTGRKGGRRGNRQNVVLDPPFLPSSL